MAVNYRYARSSLAEEKGQDLKCQTKEMMAAGAEIIIEEREHGDKDKEKLNALLFKPVDIYSSKPIECMKMIVMNSAMCYTIIKNRVINNIPSKYTIC